MRGGIDNYHLYYHHPIIKQLFMANKNVHADKVTETKAISYLQRRHCFQPKINDIFLISPQKHTLWVLINSALNRRF